VLSPKQQCVTTCVLDVLSLDSGKQKASVLQRAEQVGELSLRPHVQTAGKEHPLYSYNVVGHTVVAVDMEYGVYFYIHLGPILFQLRGLVSFKM